MDGSVAQQLDGECVRFNTYDVIFVSAVWMFTWNSCQK